MQKVLARYYYNNLKPNEKSAYRCIKHALINFKRQIYFPYVSNVYKVIEAVRWDCPHLFYVNWMTVLHKVEFLSDGRIQITVPYLYKKAVIKKMMQQIRSEVAQFKSINNPFTLALKVHDYLVNSVVYDKGDLSFGGFKYRNHNMAGAIIGKSAVCEGIAKAYQFILNLYGVDCMTVVGKTKTNGITDTGLHAWNILSLNGENYQVDVTWDLAKDICGEKRTDYAYFLIDDKTAQIDHEHKLKVVSNGKSQNIYRLTNRYITEEKQLKNFLNDLKTNKGVLARLDGISKQTVDFSVNLYAIKKYKCCQWIQFPTGVLYVKFY